MAIQIIKEPDVRVTSRDLARYRHEYEEGNKYKAGPTESFEDYVRRRQQQEWNDAGRRAADNW
jgi:hypothetical protein